MTDLESQLIDKKYELERIIDRMPDVLGDRRAACAVWDVLDTLLVGLRSIGVKNKHLSNLNEFLQKEWPSDEE